jgi:hypothetical protein
MIIQLNKIMEEYQSLRSRSEYDDLSDLLDNEIIRLITRSRASIERISGKNSVYYRQSEEIIANGGYPGYICTQIIGVVDSLKVDIEADFLKSYEELIHGELFSDFIDMARHLSSEGYKDPAAVIVGSTLESHLKKLCIKFSIETTFEKDGKNISKKADKLNSDLVKEGVYSKLDQKNITAWLDLRNKAAHGHYGEYTREQVDLLIDNISNFIARHPA